MPRLSRAEIEEACADLDALVQDAEDDLFSDFDFADDCTGCEVCDPTLAAYEDMIEDQAYVDALAAEVEALTGIGARYGASLRSFWAEQGVVLS